jgi:hypothetical protein
VGSNPTPSASGLFTTVRHHSQKPRDYLVFCAFLVFLYSPPSATIRKTFVGCFVGLGGHFTGFPTVSEGNING